MLPSKIVSKNWLLVDFYKIRSVWVPPVALPTIHCRPKVIHDLIWGKAFEYEEVKAGRSERIVLLIEMLVDRLLECQTMNLVVP